MPTSPLTDPVPPAKQCPAQFHFLLWELPEWCGPLLWVGIHPQPHTYVLCRGSSCTDVLFGQWLDSCRWHLFPALHQPCLWPLFSILHTIIGPDWKAGWEITSPVVVSSLPATPSALEYSFIIRVKTNETLRSAVHEKGLWLAISHNGYKLVLIS